MSNNQTPAQTLKPEMYSAMAEHRANYMAQKHAKSKTEVALDRAWKERLTMAWLNDYAEQRGILRSVRNQLGIQEAFAQFDAMRAEDLFIRLPAADQAKALLSRVRDFNQDLDDREVVAVLDGGDEYNELRRLVEQGLARIVAAAPPCATAPPITDIPGMTYLIKGPIEEGKHLYWSMEHGWGSRESATQIPHSQIANGLLLIGATGVDILHGGTPALPENDIFSRAHQAMADLEAHNIEPMLALVVSTAHITEDEHDALTLNATQNSCPGDDLYVAMAGDYGWIFYVGDPDIDVTKGLSEGFAGAIRFAQEKGFAWLRLDRDAARLSGVVAYDW